MNTESPQAAPSTPTPETSAGASPVPANPAEGAAAGLLPNTDDADYRTVLCGVEICALSWQPEVRLIGNVRAGDIARACREVGDEITRLHAENERLKEDRHELCKSFIKTTEDFYAERRRAEQAEAQLAKVADLVKAANEVFATASASDLDANSVIVPREVVGRLHQAILAHLSEERSGR